MDKISLYIAEKKVDLDKDTFILFNYTMEDLSNPTIVKNSFSKQITLKGTPANNEIFGNLWKADRKTIYGEGYTGVAFDPLRKTPFTIYNDMNEVIESGYVKVDSVDKVSSGYEYKVTLYGGLGSFFYSLTYNEDGSKKTLADIVWKKQDGTTGKVANRFITAYEVSEAWRYLSENSGNADWSIVNFAPCYNGFPDDFDANKVLIEPNIYDNIVPIQVIDGVQYGIKTECSTFLVSMANKHTEWEMSILMPYLQRMVVSVKEVLRAIMLKENNGGFNVILDSKFFTKNTPVIWDGWWTLPMISKEKRYSDDAIQSVLKGSLSPCEYLLGLAKMYGLVFQYDSATKSITIMPRDTFYNGEIIDLDKRVDNTTIQQTMTLADKRYLRMGNKVLGEYAALYEQTHGKPYACQDIDTGYEFNLERNVITDGIPFQEAADVVERNYLYAKYMYEFVSGFWRRQFAVPLYETCEMQLFKANSDETKNIAVSMPTIQCIPYDVNAPYQDWLPKPQFHAEDNKAIDGSHCLLLFDGIINIPSRQREDVSVMLSDDHLDIDVLNGGIPCWCITSNSEAVSELPSFRRTQVYSNGNVKSDLSWGIPLERAVPNMVQSASDPHTIYNDRWKAYLSDRYDTDTRVVRCKVNLSGLQVGQGLMRNFFFYENAIWVLNKISNHSITTDDLTECEFIKVKDIKNYTQGQKV